MHRLTKDNQAYGAYPRPEGRGFAPVFHVNHEMRWRAGGPPPAERPSADADDLRYVVDPDLPVNTPRVSSVMPDRE